MMRPRCRRPKKVLQVITHITDHCGATRTALQAQADQLHHDLGKSMRGFGRQCRGKGTVFVTLVRQTAKHLLEVGQQVLPLARAAQACLQGVTRLSDGQRARVDTTLQAAIEAHQCLAKHSRRLTQGKQVPQGKIVKAYDGTIAAICTGKSHCPAQCGRTPGMIAASASGFLFAMPLPVGHPGDRSDGLPLVDKVPHAIAQVSRRPAPAIHSLVSDLALNDPTWREALHARGMLTVGIPHTVEPITPVPTQADVLRILHEAGLSRQRTPYQVPLACACGYKPASRRELY